MKDDVLIKKIHMNCPLCDETHEVEERKRCTQIEIKGEPVLYEEHFYYCVNADEEENEFETAAMTNKNLLNARNAYRAAHGLLTSDEIVAIRESYGLSQVDLARLLGWGEATISRYESKAIQDEAYDVMLRLIKDNPLKALEFLKRNAGKFSNSKRLEIKARIVEQLNDYGMEFLVRQAIEGEYAQYEEPSDSNGYTVLDLDKIEAIISYFAERITNLFKVKLMKMLWYADALSYKRRGVAMTGLVYRHDMMGALPISHYKLMNLERLDVREETDGYYDSILHIYPGKGIDYTVIDEEEKAILDEVIMKFAAFKAKDIVDYMHRETAYRKTAQGDIIPFRLAKDIRDFS